MIQFGRLIGLFGFFLVVTGCATMSQKQELALKRATFDLDCPSGKLDAIELALNTYGVSGCGRKGTYIIDCPRGHGYNAPIEECTAILNSPKDIPSSQSNWPK